MRHPAFMVPRVRESGGLVRVRRSLEVGRPEPWPGGATVGSVSALWSAWSGMLRGLALAGYRVVEIFVEAAPASAADRLLLDTATLGLGLTDLAPDDLGVARSTDTPWLIALTLDPLQPFGEPVGAPLALALPEATLESIEGVFAETDPGRRGWLGFTSEESSFSAAVRDVRERGLRVGAVLADTIAAAWLEDPDALGAGVGLGWMFDHRYWWFPPWSLGAPEADAQLLRDVLTSVSNALLAGEVDVGEFLREQILREHDPHTFAQKGSFGRLTRSHFAGVTGGESDPAAAAAVAAYERRTQMLAGTNDPGVSETARALDRRFMWSDALLVMVEHGAVGVLHNLLPGRLSTAPTNRLAATRPEWTEPQVTGQWDAVDSHDTLILNQAGTEIAGYWQRRKAVGGLRQLDRYVVRGSMRGGNRIGGPLDFSVRCWTQLDRDRRDDVERWIYDESILGSPIDAGASITVAKRPSGEPELTLHVDLGTGGRAYEFVLNSGFAHHTDSTLTSVSPRLRDRMLALRDSPMHFAETEAVVVLCRNAVKYVNRFLEERPGGAELLVMLNELSTEVREGLGELTDFRGMDQPGRHSPLLDTARQDAKHRLALVTPLGSESYVGLLTLMFRLQWTQSRYLQSVYDLVVATVGTHHYRWRLRHIRMAGGGYWGSGAKGTGIFELQEVDERHREIGDVISRTIDLHTAEAGAVMGPNWGPSDITDWQYFYPVSRDITEHLGGARLELFGMGASWLLAETNSSVEVWFTPTDDLDDPLRGRMDGALVKAAIGNPLAGDINPLEVLEDVEKVKDVIETLKEAGKKFLKKDWKKGIKALKKPEVKVSWTFGWLRTENDDPTVPDEPEVAIGSYVSVDDTWVRYETDKYTLTDEFRQRLRLSLLWNLIMYRGTNDLTIEGHASQVGSDEYNYLLSRDRAMGVLTAIYDILGPQHAIAFGDVRVRAFGNELATGDAGSDEAWDRRVDVVLGGMLRVRS